MRHTIKTRIAACITILIVHTAILPAERENDIEKVFVAPLYGDQIDHDHNDPSTGE